MDEPVKVIEEVENFLTKTRTVTRYKDGSMQTRHVLSFDTEEENGNFVAAVENLIYEAKNAKLDAENWSSTAWLHERMYLASVEDAAYLEDVLRTILKTANAEITSLINKALKSDC